MQQVSDDGVCDDSVWAIMLSAVLVVYARMQTAREKLENPGT